MTTELEPVTTEWPKEILRSVWCGYIPPFRPVQDIIDDPITDGERVVAFAHDYLITPEGVKVGQPLTLELFQIFFILCVIDNPHKTRHAYLSIARRNGKTFIVAVILLAYLIGPLATKNAGLASGAQSRDQASLVFKLMEKMLLMSPRLRGLYKVRPSAKAVQGHVMGTEYRALAADASTGLGQSFKVVLLDEAGQIRGPTSEFVEMLTSSQGSYEDALMITISTQAASDADFLSTRLDAALRDQPVDVVAHVYEAQKGCEMMEEAQWYRANPGLGIFRSVRDLSAQLRDAERLPATESSARNLLLNQRTSQRNLWLSPTVWRENKGAPDLDLFKRLPVHFGLDLSMRNDLTAAVGSVLAEDGIVHHLPFIFAPEYGMRERALRDRADYESWVRQGYLISVPGRTIDYEWVAAFLREATKDMFVASVQFDRWSITHFQQACQAEGFEVATWIPIGQGYKDISPRLKAYETALLRGRIRHGDHPLLNMAVANAIAVKDPANNLKLDKAQSTLRIDPLVATVMSAFPCLEDKVAVFDVSSMIG